MSEYGIRKIDRREIWIGSCESMPQVRYEQKDDLIYDFGDYWYMWRIPSPKEDGTMVGDYNNSLLDNGYIPYELKLKTYSMSDNIKDSMMNSKGIIQVVVEKLGLLVNITCLHGLALPKSNESSKFFWNGKRDSLHLSHMSNKDGELKVGVTCAACGHSWSMPYNEICDYIESLWMKLRLLHVCTDYWHEHNDTPCPYSLVDRDIKGKPMEICKMLEYWQLDVNDETVKTGSWQECRNAFIERLDDGSRLNRAFEHDEYAYYMTVRELKARYLTKKK